MLKLTLTIEPYAATVAKSDNTGAFLSELLQVVAPVLAKILQAGTGPIVHRPSGEGFDGEDRPDVEARPTRDLDAEYQATLEEGTEAFGKLVQTWLQNYRVEGAPQPDRRSALMGVFSLYNRQACRYIHERGGLGGACIDALVRQGLVDPQDAVKFGKEIALNMVQIGSTLALPLDELLEKSFYVARLDETGHAEQLDDKPPSSGMAGQVVDFTGRSSLPTPSSLA